MSAVLNGEGRPVLEANGVDCLVQWLKSIRRDTEDYDPVPAPPQLSCDEEPDEPLMHKPLSNDISKEHDIFDNILSQIGLEIYKLDEYQKKIGSVDPDIVAPLARTIVNMFDVCLYDMRDDTIDSEEETDKINPEKNPSTKMNNSLQTGKAPPVPPRRRNRRSSQSSCSSIYENLDKPSEKPSPNSTCENLRKQLNASEDDEDSESTLWSYQACSDSKNSKDVYQSVWTCNGGFHRSDEILRKVLERNEGGESSDSGSSQRTQTNSVSSDTTIAVAEMSGLDYVPLIDEPDYENSENIYEEISWEVRSESTGVTSSVEVEWCDEPPEYVNLMDPSAYAMPPDVIAWKNTLLDPFYNEDEEDEWIAPEETLVYSKDQRPPYIIPRITTYSRPCRPQSFNRKRNSQEDLTNDSGIGDQHHGSIKDSIRLYESRRVDWSPVFDPPRIDFKKANSESPNSDRLGRIFSGSIENFLDRGNSSLYAASSSGDSLDVEYRTEKDLPSVRNGKSKSLVGQKPKPPVPTPRMLPRIEQFSDQSTLMHGPVKRTKLLEAGKKARKNWSDCYLVVTHTALMFFKDLKAYNATMKSLKNGGSPPSPTVARTAEIMPLRHASVGKCTPQHTSRYARALFVSWPSGDQILIADESTAGAAYWLQQIHQAITISDNTGFSYLANNPLDNLAEPTTTPVFVRGGGRIKTSKVGDSSNEDLSDSTPELSGNVRAKLRKFFMRRPTVESLMKKGIYKDEPVFGRRLEEVCPETPPRVPEFVVKCIQKIESNLENLKTDGLYRASGNLSQVQKIRLQIDQNNLSIVDANTDVHELTGSLKLFFRELKEPLIPFSLFQRILAASSIKSKDTRTKEFRCLVNLLPPCNKDTLKYLLQHLIRVTEYKEHNRMEASNLAIVFGQTLLWGPTDSVRNIAKECYQQNHVIEILLSDYSLIFNDGKS